MFLGRDGGPREGAIRLLPEKIITHPPIPEEEDSPQTPVFEDDDEPRGFVGIQKKLSRRFSDYFARRVPDAHERSGSPAGTPSSPALNARPDRTRTFSRTSKIDGSAYGYSGAYRSRLTSNVTINARRGSNLMRHRRATHTDGLRNSTSEAPNFAQRLLFANENAATNIANLWVAAAMNVDNEDPFESDAEDDEDNEDSIDLGEPLTRVDDSGRGNTEMGAVGTPLRTGSTASPLARLSRSQRPSTANSLHPASSLRNASPLPHRTNSASFSPMIPSSPRRLSMNVPTIFSHPGVKAPPAVLDAQHLLLGTAVDGPIPSPSQDALGTINESLPLVGAHSQQDVESLAMTEKAPSLISQLPIIVIIQYGVMALHTTTHDQIFMSYLVSYVPLKQTCLLLTSCRSDYKYGGLNLNAGHFAQLSTFCRSLRVRRLLTLIKFLSIVALMCLAQIAYQFYLYPYVPRSLGDLTIAHTYQICAEILGTSSCRITDFWVADSLLSQSSPWTLFASYYVPYWHNHVHPSLSHRRSLPPARKQKFGRRVQPTPHAWCVACKFSAHSLD